MSDGKSGGGGGEVDALKLYVWVMVIASVAGAGVTWWLARKTAALQKSIEAADEALPELADAKNQIQQMLEAFKKNKEDEARDQPLTWFQARWTAVGIQGPSIQPDAWKVPPDISQDGTYFEEKIGLKFSNRNPLRREQIARFAHEIERSSTRLRILRLELRRNGREDTIANDEWNGGCDVGYRYPRAKD